MFRLMGLFEHARTPQPVSRFRCQFDPGFGPAAGVAVTINLRPVRADRISE